jgi:C4-dicarboxylate transporter DctM subunit
VLTNAGIPAAVGKWCANVGAGKGVFLLLLNIVFLIAGCLVTGSAAVSILAPIFLPVAITYGIDPIHLGVIMIVNLAIGYITPPVGVNLYLAGGVAKVSIEDLVKENMPFLIATLVVLVIVNVIPGLSLWIPSLVK